MRNRRNILATALLVVTMAFMGSLQSSASVYTWSRYNLTFEVPDGGFVTYSTNTEFEVRWDEMVVSIRLYDKQGTTEKQIKENLRNRAAGYNMYDTSEGKTKKLKKFKGYYIDGVMPDGSRGLITTLVSKESNLIVQVTINYLYGNREMVDDIVQSFTEGKQSATHEQHKQKVQSKSDADREQKKLKEQQKKQQEQQKNAPRKGEKVYDV